MPKWALAVFAFAAAMVLLVSGAVAESAPSVSECDLCLGVAEDGPYACLGNVSAITTDEEDIYVRIRLEGPFYESHEATARWIDPSGELYFEDTSAVPSPSSEGYGWWDYYVIWFWIDVAGWCASEMPGEWQVVVLVDGEERCTKTFTIDLSQEAYGAIAANAQGCLLAGWIADYADEDNLMWGAEIELGPEAAGLRFEILYGTEASGGTFAGQEIGLGPNAQSLEVAGELDNSGASSIEIPWPGNESTYFFQVLIATNLLELAAGSFWQSNVVRVDRPPEEEALAANGFDQPIGGLGTDYMFGCVPDSSLVIEDCFDIQLSPAGLIAGSESPLGLTFDGAGFVTIAPTEELLDGQTAYVAYLPIDLPVRPCCEDLELTGLSLCYQSLASGDSIDSIQIGYLNDMGSFEELAAVEDDLASLTWDCAFFPFGNVVALRPLVIRFWFGLGGGFAAARAVRLGNVRAVLAPRRKPASWTGLESRPGNITCAKLLTCFPWANGEWSCAAGADYHGYQPDEPGVRVHFWNCCDEPITCGEVAVLDEAGEVVWTGGRTVTVEPGPWPEPYDRLADCELPADGNYEVVLQTSVGEFRKKFSVWRH